MNMTVRILAVAAAVSSVGAVLHADEFEEFGDFGASAPAADAAASAAAAADGAGAAAADDPAAAEGGQEGEAKADPEKDGRLFGTLPLCSLAEGVAEVFRPGAADWEPVTEGRLYALGSAYRTGPGSRLVVKLGNDSSVVLSAESSFRTCAQPLGIKSRMISLDGGVVTVKLPNNMPEGMFVVSAPGFSVINARGASRYTFRRTGDGDEAIIRCLTGDLMIEGRHFKVVEMKTASEIRIRTSQNLLFTGLYGLRGDPIVRLDQGRVIVKDFVTGESQEVSKTIDWKLSPRTAVRIHRAMPAIGEKLSVSVMTFDISGSLRNRCVFTENTAAVNSGEIGPAARGGRDEKDKNAAAASAASESVDVDVEVEPEADGDAAAGGAGAPAEQKPASGAGGGEELDDLF